MISVQMNRAQTTAPPPLFLPGIGGGGGGPAFPANVTALGDGGAGMPIPPALGCIIRGGEGLLGFIIPTGDLLMFVPLACRCSGGLLAFVPPGVVGCKPGGAGPRDPNDCSLP
eukprot:g10781.t1